MICFKSSHDWPLLASISESPASSTAIVEHLYSLPHAVPSSIYTNMSAVMLRFSLPLTYMDHKSIQLCLDSIAGPGRRMEDWGIEVAHVVSREVMHIGLGQHRVVCTRP